MNLSDIIPEGCVLLDLKSTQKEDVLREMVAALVAAGKIGLSVSEKALKRLMDREERGSTGIGDGVAIPHAIFEAPSAMVSVFGRSATGVEYDALDGRPVNLLFMSMSFHNKQSGVHLAALACVSKLVRDDSMLQALRDAKDVEGIRTLLRNAEFKK